MSFQFRPATRENTPLIVGIAGPTKSGKTFSALRLATGLANGSEVIMLNAEGARGHQYADTFKYTACDLVPPYRYGMYEDVLREAAKRKPGAIIVDSISHAHDGPGGFLEWHEEELDRMAGKDFAKRDKANFAAWIKPKAAENSFRYALLETACPVILAMRAKEKIKIVGGKPVDLGWQPIVGEGLSFETIFTLMLTPRCQGVPDLGLSDMREPFDKIVPKGEAIDERLGARLAAWAKGGAGGSSAIAGGHPAPAPAAPESTGGSPTPVLQPNGEPVELIDRAVIIGNIRGAAAKASLTPKQKADLQKEHLNGASLEKADVAALSDMLAAIRKLLPEDKPAA